MTNSSLIIGLAGKKGCGKSTAARSIWKNDGSQPYNFSRMAFADPLKDMVESLLFCFGVKDMYALDKNDIIPGLGVTLRHLYQTLGTGWGRKQINPHLWVNAAAESIKLSHRASNGFHIVFDDVRFDNEADFIRNQGGLIIHIERIGLVSDDPHESEWGVEFKPGDEKLVNDNTDNFIHQFVCLVESRILTAATHP